MSRFNVLASLLTFSLLHCVSLTTSLPFVAFSEHDSPDVISGSAMLKILDSMQQFLTGEEHFDRKFYSELRDCMKTFDIQLPLAQDKAWQGIIDYWNSDGAANDAWGKTKAGYSEYNATVTNLDGMIIYEPCDYASNVAYYHDVTEFCQKISSSNPFSLGKEYQNALGKIFSNLAMGSAFMHGSHTILGRQQDRIPLKAMAYLIHQASLSSLASASSIIRDFTSTPRKRTALEIVEDFQNMYLSDPVEKWFNKTETFDVPKYELTFAGLFCTIFSIGFDEELVDDIIPILIDTFSLPSELREFVLHQYLPELRKAISNIHINDIDRYHFVGNVLTPSIKLIYAFLWQERELTKSKIFIDPVVNFIGWELLPRINRIANQFSTFKHYDENFQQGVNVYPGEEWCNPVIPHAKWHLESGIGLLDLTFLADEMFRLLAGTTK